MASATAAIADSARWAAAASVVPGVVAHNCRTHASAATTRTVPQIGIAPLRLPARRYGRVAAQRMAGPSASEARLRGLRPPRSSTREDQPTTPWQRSELEIRSVSAERGLRRCDALWRERPDRAKRRREERAPALAMPRFTAGRLPEVVDAHGSSCRNPIASAARASRRRG